MGAQPGTPLARTQIKERRCHDIYVNAAEKLPASPFHDMPSCRHRLSTNCHVAGIAFPRNPQVAGIAFPRTASCRRYRFSTGSGRLAPYRHRLSTMCTKSPASPFHQVPQVDPPHSGRGTSQTHKTPGSPNGKSWKGDACQGKAMPMLL